MSTTTVSIYWDEQDMKNPGWAYRRVTVSEPVGFDGEPLGLPGQRDEDTGPIDTLDELYYALRGAEISDRSELQADDLPTFGGDEPDDTEEVLSWDETRLLVQTEAGIQLVPRTTYSVCDTTNGRLDEHETRDEAEAELDRLVAEGTRINLENGFADETGSVERPTEQQARAAAERFYYVEEVVV
ncbi:MAG: hypothetical protein ACLFVU_02150 [Phycisphaerae bacterium]